jgi:AcrR family transcriptional regulator
MTASPAAEDTRARILDAGYALFYRRGYVRVSLEAIAADAGVTKRTLYYHFRSKDDLLAAALDAHAELALARIRSWGAAMPQDIGAAIGALFEAVAAWARQPGFEGAGYTRLVMELADLPGHPARAIAARHKAQVEAWLAAELAARGVAGPAAAARRLQVLLEGAVLLMLIHGDAAYASEAAAAAREVIGAHRHGKPLRTASSPSPTARRSPRRG